MIGDFLGPAAAGLGFFSGLVTVGFFKNDTLSALLSEVWILMIGGRLISHDDCKRENQGRGAVCQSEV